MGIHAAHFFDQLKAQPIDEFLGIQPAEVLAISRFIQDQLVQRHTVDVDGLARVDFFVCAVHKRENSHKNQGDPSPGDQGLMVQKLLRHGANPMLNCLVRKSANDLIYSFRVFCS